MRRAFRSDTDARVATRHDPACEVIGPAGQRASSRADAVKRRTFRTGRDSQQCQCHDDLEHAAHRRFIGTGHAATCRTGHLTSHQPLSPTRDQAPHPRCSHSRPAPLGNDGVEATRRRECPGENHPKRTPDMSAAPAREARRPQQQPRQQAPRAHTWSVRTARIARAASRHRGKEGQSDHRRNQRHQRRSERLGPPGRDTGPPIGPRLCRPVGHAVGYGSPRRQSHPVGFDHGSTMQEPKGSGPFPRDHRRAAPLRPNRDEV